METSVPGDNPLSSHGKPRDANRRSSEQIFLSHPHTHDRFLYAGISSRVRALNFGLSFHLYPYFVYLSSEGSGKSK